LPLAPAQDAPSRGRRVRCYENRRWSGETDRLSEQRAPLRQVSLPWLREPVYDPAPRRSSARGRTMLACSELRRMASNAGQPGADDAAKSSPWLEGFDGDRGEAFERLLTFLCRPAFGSRSKREIELEVVRLLYEKRVRLGTLTVGEVADALAISRSKARSYLQEVRARIVAGETAAGRQRILYDAVVHWPLRGQIEQDKKSERLRVVVEDAYLRDLLKTHAYRSNVVLDASFSSEIVTLSWPAYERLLRSLIPDEQADGTLDIFAADVRAVLTNDDETLHDFERELEALRKADLSPREKAIKGAKLVSNALPTMVGMGGLVGL
jgi:hypothetical protein